MNIFEYLLDPSTWVGAGKTLDLLLPHLAYTAAAVGIAALIAIPLGILIGHTGRGSFLVIGLTNGARAIPSLGLLVLVVLLLGTGFFKAVGVLTLLALPAILLFVVLLMLPQDRLRGAVISRTRERFKVPTVPAAFAWGVVLVAVVAMLQALLVDTDLLKLNQAMGLSIMALSLVLLSGYAGQVNLALFAFAGIAAIAAWQFDVGPGG